MAGFCGFGDGFVLLYLCVVLMIDFQRPRHMFICFLYFKALKINRFSAIWTSNYMVCDIYRAQNRLVFCALVVGGFVIVRNCKFFAEIWAQGEFCDF